VLLQLGGFLLGRRRLDLWRIQRIDRSDRHAHSRLPEARWSLRAIIMSAPCFIGKADAEFAGPNRTRQS